MTIRPANLFWLAVLLLVVAGFIYAAIPARPDDRAKEAVAATRQLLRQQGFKTDLADFDFSTSPELRAREAILKATVPTNRFAEPFRDHPNLMEIVGANSAIVVWKQDALKRQNPSWPDNNDEMTWDEFRKAVNANQPEIDAACAAILSGPIAFNLNARAGNAMRLPHLAMLKNLTQIFGDRIVLALHDGDKNSAWTNLLAATRLVTAWQTEPVEISRLVRFGDTKLVFNATWQALQTNGWSDEQLARLQAEWESVNFFTNLPETAAFKRASYVMACEQERHEISNFRPPFGEFFNETLHYPSGIWDELRYRWSREDYPRHGAYNDETNLLIFYRNREMELRNAIQVSTWAQMRQLPGVTNKIFFQSKYRSRLQSMLNLHELSMAFQRQGGSLLSRAAEAEARRRIIITAIALERFYDKNGSHPKTLAKLAPEFLKTIPLDFMDGQPLRYRLTDDGHFILYSVGLDCVDNGGKLPAYEWKTKFPNGTTRFAPPPDADIVWPLPASAAAVTSRRRKQLTVLQNRIERAENAQATEQWARTARHQAAVERLLAATQITPDPIYHGHPLSELLRSQNGSGTNQLTLLEMLALKQIITGEEPEIVTFEVPVSYDAVINLGELVLLIDPTNDDDSDEGCLVQQMKCHRAVDGNCLLIWNTIYESPGKHALQADLLLNEPLPNNPDICGPMLPFIVSNLCQFSVTSAHFDPEMGATFHAKLPETNGIYTIKLITTNGVLLKTITGSTSNGIIKAHWNLIDGHGHRFTNDFFNSIFHIKLPESGRSQTLKGP